MKAHSLRGDATLEHHQRIAIAEAHAANTVDSAITANLASEPVVGEGPTCHKQPSGCGEAICYAALALRSRHM